MRKFRRKQVEVEAVQFVDGRYGEAIDFCPRLIVRFSDEDVAPKGTRLIQGARVRDRAIRDGDWIVRDATGDYVVKSDAEFSAEYEAL